MPPRRADRAAAATTTPLATEAADDDEAGTFTDECPAAGDVRPARPDDDAHPARTRERVGNVVPEFGCTYIGPNASQLAIAGNRERFDDGDTAADHELDVYDFGPGDLTAAGPLDSERDLDLGDRAFTNSRVTEARAGDGYVVNARFIARLGARVCKHGALGGVEQGEAFKAITAL
ncbi:MAG TPA: hypothetical protein VFM27_11865 [Acidimicrobiales bacterium]|nr:hypothetical protein [Acidimicrobiales bacterium]